MIKDIKGLHHVTSMASDARQNNTFFTETLGLRRVKKTVNFDAPEVYHLYYGDAQGTPGTVMTYFPFGSMPKGKRGTGEVSSTEFAIPKGSLPFWTNRLSDLGVTGLEQADAFGAARLTFDGPDGDSFALVEDGVRGRSPWASDEIPEDVGILGFRGVRMRLSDTAAPVELLEYMGYSKVDDDGGVLRYAIEGGNPADVVDIELAAAVNTASQGAGSVHHVAFAVEDRAAQLAVRQALVDTGHQVTPVIDRDYFWAIYFRAPGGVLFEVATNEPGFDRDEDAAHLGEALKLPTRYEKHRAQIEDLLPAI